MGGGTGVHLFRRNFFSLKGTLGGVGGHIELGGGGGWVGDWDSPVLSLTLLVAMLRTIKGTKRSQPPQKIP